MKEFSLDEENSALSRLVEKVGNAQQKITEEFSLDNDRSALARLKRELTAILSAHIEATAEFQEEIKIALGKLVTKREEATKSTRHGDDFEDAVCTFLEHDCQARGDVASRTGKMTGLIRNRKYGDCVVELGPESAAPGAKIVVEAKEEEKYSLAKAREELELARKNRDARLGLFVFSKRTAPENLPAFCRYGDGVFVVWDPENSLTDVNLHAGLSVARALSVRARRLREHEAADFEAIDRAILEIEKRAQGIENIRKLAETINSNSTTILNDLRTMHESLERQVATLSEKTADLRASIDANSE